MGIKSLRGDLQICWLKQIIRVESDDVRGGNQSDPIVSCRCETTVWRAYYSRVAPLQRSQDFYRLSISGSVVNHHNFNRWTGLGNDAVDGFFHEASEVIARNDDSRLDSTVDLRSLAE